VTTPVGWVDEAIGCPHCLGEKCAEPEQDGDTRYYACTNDWCQAEFGHQIIRTPGGVCAAGLPVEVLPSPDAPVFLGSIGRRPGE
jgi:hypothetical protein